MTQRDVEFEQKQTEGTEERISADDADFAEAETENPKPETDDSAR